MGFNYSKEKFIFDKEWEKLREQYRKAGMSEESIQELYDFDWSWFRMRRNYENRVQAMPEEEIDEQNAETRSNLFQRFTSLSTSFDEVELSGRYAWMDTISDDALSEKLKELSDYELEEQSIGFLLQLKEKLDNYEHLEEIDETWDKCKNFEMAITTSNDTINVHEGQIDDLKNCLQEMQKQNDERSRTFSKKLKIAYALAGSSVGIAIIGFVLLMLRII